MVQDSANIKQVTFTFQGDDDEYQYFGLDNVRIQLGSVGRSSLVPQHGLLQWLRADKGIVPGTNPPFETVGTWVDQSGNGNSATTFSSNWPIFLPQDGATCQPTIDFTGTEALTFQLPINGLHKMTIFLVSRANQDPAAPAYSHNAALFWVENTSWGSTYLSPFQTHVAYAFGTTQAGNAPDRPRSQDIGGDFALTTAVHDGTVDTLYINGSLTNTEANRESTLAGTTGEGFIGMGYQNTFFTDEISEILVYNRVLSRQERNAVTYYLTSKYGLR